MYNKTAINLFLCIIAIKLKPSVSAYEIVYALNVGGSLEVDSHGIRFKKDNTNEATVVACQQHYTIGGITQSDDQIYRTQRYSGSTFGFDIPVIGDGHYVLNLKFADCWSTVADARYFDITLNQHQKIVSHLDLIKEAGRFNAHDEFVSFEICDGQLWYGGEKSRINNKKMRLQFMRLKDNPHIAAILLLKGSVEELKQKDWLAKVYFVDKKDQKCSKTQDGYHPINEKEEFYKYFMNKMLSSNSTDPKGLVNIFMNFTINLEKHAKKAEEDQTTLSAMEL